MECRLWKHVAGLGLLVMMTSCQTYNYAEKVKYMSFSNRFGRGAAVGPVVGKDCAWTIAGYEFGTPSLQNAFIAAATGKSKDGILSTFKSTESGDGLKYRYITDVRTSNEGFNAVIVAKNCVVLKGRGFK